MRSVGIIVLLVVLMSSGIGCTSDVDSQSGIPDSLLVDVLVHVYSAAARAKLQGTDIDLARIEALEKFHLDTTGLNRTLDHLAAHPDSAALVYQRALDSLIVIQRELRAASDIDSLQKLVRG